MNRKETKETERYSAMIDYLSREFQKKKVVGAEIGVFRGENARNILEKLNLQKLYLIDSYDYEDLNYRDLARKHLKIGRASCRERV